MDERVAPPASGSAGDPTLGGATLTVYNAGGLTADTVTVTLPASGWTPIGPAAAPSGWRFRGAGAVRSVVVKADKLTLRGGGSTWGYSLDESAQGSVAVRVQLGSDAGWCAVSAATPRGTPPSTAQTDRPGLFNASKGGPAPAPCPPLP